MEVERRVDDKTLEEDRIGQINNPLDLSKLDLDPLYIKIVSQLISFEDHEAVPSLTKEDIIKCDEVVKKLVLDRQRATYFSRSRQYDQTEQISAHHAEPLDKETHFFDKHWK